MSEKKYQGTVARFGVTFGFLFCEELGRRVFFHIAEFASARNPIVGEDIDFVLIPSRTPGKPEAAGKVTPIFTEGK